MEWPSYCLYLPSSPLNYALRWTAPFIAHSSTVAIVLQTPTCIMLKFDIIDWINEDRSFNKRIDRLSERIDRIREDRSINERIDRISEDRSFNERIDRLSERIDRIREDRSINERIDRISEDRSFSQRIDRLSERIDRIREDRSITKKKCATRIDKWFWKINH